MSPGSDPRIRKLLALAADNLNAPEAQAALLKVQARFLALAPWPPVDQPVVHHPVARDLSLWFQRLVRVVETNFRVLAYADYEAAQVYFAGRTDDAILAEQVLEAARRSAQNLASAWWKAHPDETLLAQEDFLHGYGTRLEERFVAQVANQGWAPQLVRDAGVQVTDLVPSPVAVTPLLTSDAAFAQGRRLEE